MVAPNPKILEPQAEDVYWRPWYHVVFDLTGVLMWIMWTAGLLYMAISRVMTFHQLFLGDSDFLLLPVIFIVWSVVGFAFVYLMPRGFVRKVRVNNRFIYIESYFHTTQQIPINQVRKLKGSLICFKNWRYGYFGKLLIMEGLPGSQNVIEKIRKEIKE